jgi:hypothetical protein
MSPVSIARWLKVTLIVAGCYNLLWGAAVVLFPESSYRYGGLWTPDRPLVNVPVWQCVGMIVGVYGVGYLIAGRDPVRHWPIVLVGLLGKVFGPIGCVVSVAHGELPASTLATNLTNDLIWWVPFGLILHRAWVAHLAEEGEPPPDPAGQALCDARTQTGMSIAELSKVSPVLLIFLRHFG